MTGFFLTCCHEITLDHTVSVCWFLPLFISFVIFSKSKSKLHLCFGMSYKTVTVGYMLSSVGSDSYDQSCLNTSMVLIVMAILHSDPAEMSRIRLIKSKLESEMGTKCLRRFCWVFTTSGRDGFFNVPVLETYLAL